MPTYEWGENYANKIKEQTWKISDRFTEMDRLDLRITNKLASKKAALLEYINDPVKMYSLSERDKQTIATLRKYAPSLFKEVEGAPKFLQSYLEKQQKTAQNKVTQLGLAGEIDKPQSALATAMEKGYLPDLRDKNFLGAWSSITAFPLKKLMSLMSTAERTHSAMTTELTEQGKKYAPPAAETDHKNRSSLIYGVPDKENILTLEDLKKLNEGKPSMASQYGNILKEGAKAFINLKDSKYQDWTYAKGIKKTNPEEGTPFGFAKDWETGNWFQRLFSGFAGSPADIAGLGFGILLDPLTYLSGGLSTGAKQGVNLIDDLIKAGEKILPAGAEIGLTKTGRTAFDLFFKSKYGNVIDDITKGVIKVAGGATDDIAKNTLLNALRSKALNEFIQQTPDAMTALKYLDLGGTKFMGETIIPGYKYAQKFGKLKNKGAVQTLGKLFNENAGIPDELVPFKNWILSAGEAEKAAQIKDFATIIKNANKADLDNVQKYMWQMADIERATNKLDVIGKRIADLKAGSMQGVLFGQDATSPLLRGQTRITNLLEKYTNRIKGLSLTNKQLTIADNLTDYWKKIADQFRTSTGKPLNAYDIYSPIRYTREGTGLGKTTLTGAIDQPFVKARNITMAQAEKLGYKPKSLIESTMQRLYEQERNVFRSRLLEEVKQFGSTTAKPGLAEIKGIPELVGTYLPKEYEKVFKTTYSTFFGDDALKNVMKIYDKGLTVWKRWALATPGYHFRNFFTDNVSGLMEYGADWYNPKHWSNMNAVLKKEHKLITLNGIKRYADDVYREMVETGELVTQTGIESLVGGASSKFGKAMQKISPAEWSLKFGVKREDMGRVLAGVIERDAGSSKIMAALNVKKVFFDYAHSLTPFETNIMKRAIPFYRWLKNNLRRQIELIFKRTGRYAAIPKTMNFVEGISDIPEGYEEFKPDYYKNLSAFATPLRNPGLPDFIADIFKKPRTTKAGDMLVANPNLAFQDWSRLNPRDLFSSLSPFIKAPIELLADKNIYYGTNIKEGQKDKEVSFPADKLLKLIPASLLEKMGITKTADGKITIPPRMDYLLKTFLPQYALAQRGFADTENTPFQNLSALTGLKFFPYNEEKAKQAYTTNWLKKANQKLDSFEQKQGEGYTLPATDDIAKAYKQIYADYMAQKFPNIAIARQIKEMTKYAGSNAETNLVIKLMEKPYEDEMAKIKGKTLAELSQILSELGINPTMEDINNVLNQLEAK